MHVLKIAQESTSQYHLSRRTVVKFHDGRGKKKGLIVSNKQNLSVCRRGTGLNRIEVKAKTNQNNKIKYCKQPTLAMHGRKIKVIEGESKEKLDDNNKW